MGRGRRDRIETLELCVEKIRVIKWDDNVSNEKALIGANDKTKF